MAKMFIFFACMSLALFDSTQSVTLTCEYKNSLWIVLGTPYHCDVHNSVSITSLDAATVEDIAGDHKFGFDNDDVKVFSLNNNEQVHYFPRDLNKFFKNIKEMQIINNGLKEIHQSDLKHFPQLKFLYLQGNQLEILEENLFEFNSNLEVISFNFNGILHIDPNVFDKLDNLFYLGFQSNTCIDMYAANNPTEIEKIINTAKTQCTNTEYSNLEQKVKNLEIESKYLNSENFKEKLQNLENEIKNSKFPNFFQENLRDLKSVQFEKAEDERVGITTEIGNEAKNTKIKAYVDLNEKIDEIVTNLNDLMAQVTNRTDSNKTDVAANHNGECAAIKEEMANFTENVNTKLEILKENVENLKFFTKGNQSDQE